MGDADAEVDPERLLTPIPEPTPSVPPPTSDPAHAEPARDNGASSPDKEDAGTGVPEAAAPADEWNIDLRDPWWTYERLLAAAERSQNGYDWTKDSTLTPDHFTRRASADPKPDLDLSQPGRVGGRKPSAKGRLVTDVVASGEDSFVVELAQAVELPAGACMAVHAGVEVNLKRLFEVVAAHGGSDAVRINRQWTAVADAVTPPADAGPNTNRGLVHRQAYDTLLLAYEQLLDARGQYAPICVTAKREFAEVLAARKAAQGTRGRPARERNVHGGRRGMYACDVCNQSDLGIIRLYTCDWCERTLCTTCGFGDDDEAALDNQTLRKCVDCAQRDKNRDYCEVCRSHDGELLNCSSCPASYHAGCAPSAEEPAAGSLWVCPSCVEGGNAAADAVEALALMDASVA